MKNKKFFLEDVNKIVLILFDFFTLFISFFVAIFLLNFLNLENYLPNNQFDNWLLTHFTLSFFCIIWFWIKLRHYTYRKPFWLELKEILRTLIIFSVIELSFAAFSKLYFSRYLWVFIWISAITIFPLGRVLLKKYLIRTGSYDKNLVIIGAGNNALDTYLAIIEERYLGFKPKYFISVDNDISVSHLDVPVLDVGQKDVLHLVDKSTQFIIALEEYQSEEQNNWLRCLSKHNCRFISVIPTIRGLPLYGTDMAFLFSHEILLLRINNNLAKRSSKIIKRVMDILGSLFLLIILFPFLLVIYLLIVKDGGNAIYGHIRIGHNRKVFKCLKFRTMRLNSDGILKSYLKIFPEAKDELDRDFKLKNDPRVTKIGRFLRQMSLDELPQLFNVLKGEMSLVGPRPVVRAELERYEEDIDYYFMAKPGMTGLWQVSGRNDVDYETRVYFDAWYVKNWSIWNDMVILFKTINVVLKRDGAY